MVSKKRRVQFTRKEMGDTGSIEGLELIFNRLLQCANPNLEFDKIETHRNYGGDLIYDVILKKKESAYNE